MPEDTQGGPYLGPNRGMENPSAQVATEKLIEAALELVPWWRLLEYVLIFGDDPELAPDPELDPPPEVILHGGPRVKGAVMRMLDRG